MTILTTPRCTLRPFTQEDAVNLIPILGSEAVMRYSMTGAMDLPTISNTINGWIALYENHGFGPWAVIYQGQLIGYAGLDRRVVEEIEQIQITFRLAEHFWGKGFATELALSIREYAFQHLKLPSLIAIVDPENLASIHTISKIGMQFEKAVIYGGLPLHVYKIEHQSKMHDDELEIDEPLVTKLLRSQLPNLANLPITRLTHSGTDHAIFRLGDEYAIRLPRVSSAEEQMLKEQEWLPKLGQLPLTTPNPIANGKPSNDYPYHWYAYRWIEGINAYDQKPSDLQQAAIDLAAFIKALWKMDTAGAPPTRRGLPLSSQDRDVWVNSSATALKEAMDENKISTIMGLWEKYRNTAGWSTPPVWLHGDLLPSNLLVQNGKLHAVIDFGLAGIGDPACDLIPAWSLFDSASRSAFKNALGIDEDTWNRGKGWALSIAIIIIPYYLHTNPVLVSVAKRMIEEITRDL